MTRVNFVNNDSRAVYPVLLHSNGRAGSVHILENPEMAINLYMCGADTHRFEAICEQFTKSTFLKFGKA